MARRTLAAMDAEVALRLANRSDVSPTMRGYFLRDAYVAIADLFPHPEIQFTAVETLLINSDELTPLVATDMWYPEMVRNITDGYLIDLESRERVERAQTKPTSPPYKYYWYRRKFIFEAFANTQKNIKLWYKTKPVQLASNQSSILDEIFDPLIIIEAARIGLESVNDYDAEERQRKRWDEYVMRRKLPVNQAKLNDYRQGFKVRFR